MSEYNAMNYTEQGGDVTHIGGMLILSENCIGGELMRNVPFDFTTPNTGTTQNKLNQLLMVLKDSGLMVGDPFDMTVTKEVKDRAESDGNRAYNISKIESVELTEENHIVISLSCDVDDLKDFDAGDEGVHKWIGIGLSVGINVSSLKLNGEFLSDDKKSEATAMGLDNLYFVLWIKAEEIANRVRDSFTLWTNGYRETEYVLEITTE